jgi:conjugal transfer pilus assembly protein TraV
MINKKLAFSFAALTTLLSGCMAQIGKNDFACPDGTTVQDGVCAGPRTIHQLTNNRDSLTDLSDEEIRKLRPEGSQEEDLEELEEGDRSERIDSIASHREYDQREPTVYKGRDNRQQSPSNYQRAKTVDTQVTGEYARDKHQGWPNYEEPLAPEPLAVVNPPKIMRILVKAWSDNAGNLNMPGYVYVEVEPRTFGVGSAANTRPTRVIPFEMRERTQEEERRQKQRAEGVNPLETVNPYQQQ